MSELIQVFVYGTLKPGEINYQRYCAGRGVEAIEAIALGQLYHLSLGYPAMTAGIQKTQKIKGYVLSFTDPKILDDLDVLEGFDAQRPPHQNDYDRVKIQVYDRLDHPLGQVWTYVMDIQQIQALQGILLLDGEWYPRTKA